MFEFLKKTHYVALYMEYEANGTRDYVGSLSPARDMIAFDAGGLDNVFGTEDRVIVGTNGVTVIYTEADKYYLSDREDFAYFGMAFTFSARPRNAYKVFRKKLLIWEEEWNVHSKDSYTRWFFCSMDREVTETSVCLPSNYNRNNDGMVIGTAHVLGGILDSFNRACILSEYHFEKFRKTFQNAGNNNSHLVTNSCNQQFFQDYDPPRDEEGEDDNTGTIVEPGDKVLAYLRAVETDQNQEKEKTDLDPDDFCINWEIDLEQRPEDWEDVNFDDEPKDKI